MSEQLSVDKWSLYMCMHKEQCHSKNLHLGGIVDKLQEHFILCQEQNGWKVDKLDPDLVVLRSEV